tara:strand:- start:220482 stop:221519 length:1038 start_codon:yes stop_codon:yes gene_type:complete
MVYLAGWSLVYFTLLTSAINRYRGRAFGFFTILFFAFIAIFRGATGTDTANYELIFENLFLENFSSVVEPAFGLLGFFLTELLGSAQLGVRAVSVLFYILVGFYYYRSDRNEAFVLLAYLAPAFFYIYSMNGLRIGIASILLLLAVQSLRRGCASKSGVTALVSVLCHYTIVFSIAYIAINHLKNIKWKYLLFLGVTSLVVFYVAQEHILLKINLYLDFESPNPLSGLSKVIVVIILISGVMFSNLPSSMRNKIIFLTILFTGLAFTVASYSYAGLRILDLISFALAIIILMAHFEVKQLLNWKIKLSFILAGFTSAAFLYRGFLIEAGQGKSPFLPYKMIGELF